MNAWICFAFLGLTKVLFSFEPEILNQLQTEGIISQIPMEEFLEKKGHIVHFSNPVYLVELSSGIKAVLKVANADWPQDAITEVAAYRASEYLELDLVPPTVLYENNGVIGSLQYYIEPALDLMADDNYEKVMQMISEEEKANIALFYFVLGQWDQDASNLIAYETKEGMKVGLIDNAAMGYRQKVQYGDHPFVICFPDVFFPLTSSLESFPFKEKRQLPPIAEIWDQDFGCILEKWQIKTLCRLKKTVTFVLWQGHLWRQYGFGMPNYTEYYPKKILGNLKQLDLPVLQSFFENTLDFAFSEAYFQDILERKAQVLTHENFP